MLRSANELKGYVLQALDGEIGRTKDLLFDDEFWTIRSLVADTHKWLPGRKVLISPIALGSPEWHSGRFPVQLTREQIKNAPALDEDAPVSRQYEMLYHRHFNWPFYWGGAEAWGAAAYAAPLFATTAPPKPDEPEEEPSHRHLRSVSEVVHYAIDNGSEKLGHVQDFIIEEGTWAIRYMVVDTGNWLPGRKVLVSPAWIEDVSWKKQNVSLWLTREEVKASPPYDPSAPINRKYEELLYDFYGRPSYWSEKEAARALIR